MARKGKWNMERKRRMVDPTNRYIIHIVYHVGLGAWVDDKIIFFTGRVIYFHRPTGDPYEIMSDGERCFRWPFRMVLMPYEEWKNGRKTQKNR